MLFLAELSKKRQSLIEYITICNGIKFWEETLSENHRNSKNPLTLWELPLALTTSSYMWGNGYPARLVYDQSWVQPPIVQSKGYEFGICCFAAFRSKVNLVRIGFVQSKYHHHHHHHFIKS